MNYILLSHWFKNSSKTPTYKGDPLIWSFLRHNAFTNMPYYINKRMKKALYFTFLMQVRPFNHISAGVCCCSNFLKFLEFQIFFRGGQQHFSKLSLMRNFSQIIASNSMVSSCLYYIANCLLYCYIICLQTWFI